MMDWRSLAACRGIDAELFMGEKYFNHTDAKRLCESCPVKAECLEYALGFNPDYLPGVWGGKSVKERRVLRRERRAVA